MNILKYLSNLELIYICKSSRMEGCKQTKTGDSMDHMFWLCLSPGLVLKQRWNDRDKIYGPMLNTSMLLNNSCKQSRQNLQPNLNWTSQCYWRILVWNCFMRSYAIVYPHSSMLMPWVLETAADHQNRNWPSTNPETLVNTGVFSTTDYPIF